MSGVYVCVRREIVSYWSGSLKPRMVEPCVNPDAAAKKAVRTVGPLFQLELIVRI